MQAIPRHASGMQNASKDVGPHCALMNLFCLAEWRAAHHGEQGHERDLDEVGELGRSEWGTSHEGCNCQESATAECGR